MSIETDNILGSRVRASYRTLAFILIIVAIAAPACGSRTATPAPEKHFSDPNERMYQMYYDSSGSPALNELQSRRFMGHLHMADLEELFGDVQALPLDENCNHIGGPVEKDGYTWFLIASADLVGANLISVAPDGTRSSAFDLDGDRIVDLLDIRMGDGRRWSIFTEELGLEVFRVWVEGVDPFCNPELARQLGLPELGCDDVGGGGSSEGGAGFGADSGIVDPIDLLCSQYDTSPWSRLMTGAARGGPSIVAGAPRRLETHDDSVTSYTGEDGHEYLTLIKTFVTTDVNSGGIIFVTKVIYEFDASVDPPQQVSTTREVVRHDGSGVRTSQRFNPDGTPAGASRRETFQVAVNKRTQDYDRDSASPPPQHAGQTSSAGSSASSESSGVFDDTDEEGTAASASSAARDNPGPEPDGSRIAEFCRERANYRSGIEQAVSEDPTAISLSCGELVDAPVTRHCTVLEWASAGDIHDALEPPSDDDSCDSIEAGNGMCEPATIQDRIRRIRGRVAQLWSFNVPDIVFCPAVLCDPAESVQLQSYTAGGIQIACPAAEEPAALEPSEENCPPGTYYAPVTNRCIAIQLSEPGNDGGGACTLTTQACTNQGLSFDINKCECVPVQ